MANLHFSPFAPYFCKVFNCFKVDLGSLLQDLPGAFQVTLCFSFDATFFIEFGKVDIEPVEIRSGFPGVYRGQRISIRLRYL